MTSELAATTTVELTTGSHPVKKPLVVMRRNTKVTVDVPEEVLAKMTIYNSKDKTNVLEVSKQCKVMLLLLRHMRCGFCKYAIVRMAELYKTLLQCNTIPVLIHYETEEEATEYIGRCPAYLNHANKDIIPNLFRVADPTGDYFYNQFNIEEVKTRYLVDALSNLKLAPLVERKTGIQNPKNVFRKHWARYPAFFIIENGMVVNAFYARSVKSTIDYTRALVDPERDSCAGDVCPATYTPEELNQLFGVYVDSLQKHQGKDLDVFGLFKGSLLCIAETNVDTQDVLPVDADSVDLQTVLVNDDNRRFFKLYAIKEISVENVLCYEAIMKFKERSSTVTLSKEAEDIHKKFFTDGSHLEINIGAELKRDITKKLNSGEYDRTIFDQVITYLEGNNLSDTFNRFRRHPSFLDMIDHQKRSAKK